MHRVGTTTSEFRKVSLQQPTHANGWCFSHAMLRCLQFSFSPLCPLLVPLHHSGLTSIVRRSFDFLLSAHLLSLSRTFYVPNILCSSLDFLASETSYLFILLCIHSPPTIRLLWSEWQLYDSRSSTYRCPLNPSPQEWALPKNMSKKEEMSKSVVLMVVLQSCLS